MRRILFSVMTAGERPEAALHYRQDWFAHTDEFRRDCSAPAYVFELLRGALCHLAWRVTGKSDTTLLPFSFMLMMQAAVVTLFAVVGNPAADYNQGLDLVTAVVFLLWVCSALKSPWDLNFRWDFSVLLMLVGVVEILTALTIRPASTVNVVSFLVSGLGAVLVSSSSMRQKLILGSSLTSVLISSLGAILGVVRLVSNVRGDGLSAIIGISVIGASLTAGMTYWMWRVWFAGQYSATEAVGGPSDRSTPGLNMYAQ